MTEKFKIGLSLSGGGYRAAAFHLGTLNKLNEMKLLERVGVMSTISGGSIIGAYYCLHGGDYNSFRSDMYEALAHKNVIRKVLLSSTFLQAILFCAVFVVPTIWVLFTEFAWLSPIIFALFIFLLLRFQFYIFPVSKRIEDVYDEFFYKSARLGDLPEKPVLVIGSTNLQTSRPFVFSRERMGDTTYSNMSPAIKFKQGMFPISRAVMASSCVPFAFTPLKINAEYFESLTDSTRVHPILVDGGVFDNQGIHKLTHQGRYNAETVITSDAGGGKFGELSFRNTVSLLTTTVDVFMTRIKNIQVVADVYENSIYAKKEIAYISLAWDAEKLIDGFISNLGAGHIVDSVITAHQLKPEWVEDSKKYYDAISRHLQSRIGYDDIIKPSAEQKLTAKSTGTNLTSFSKPRLDSLIAQGECLTELQVKLYCPSLLNLQQ